VTRLLTLEMACWHYAKAACGHCHPAAADSNFKGTSAISMSLPAQVLFWDTRQGTSPVLAISDAHGKQDIQAVDWSALREASVATGEGSKLLLMAADGWYCLHPMLNRVHQAR
jgi:hypothetical protein